jgi:hypothetical protein
MTGPCLPQVDSAEAWKDYDEVREWGSNNSSLKLSKPYDTASAHFWLGAVGGSTGARRAHRHRPPLLSWPAAVPPQAAAQRLQHSRQGQKT